MFLWEVHSCKQLELSMKRGIFCRLSALRPFISIVIPIPFGSSHPCSEKLLKDTGSHDDVIKCNIAALLALCAGNSPATGEFSSQRPVTRSFDVFFDLRLNKRLSKQSWGWWLETTSRSLWRRCNVILAAPWNATERCRFGLKSQTKNPNREWYEYNLPCNALTCVTLWSVRQILHQHEKCNWSVFFCRC